MCSATLRQGSLALFLFAMTIGLVPAAVEAEEKSIYYRLGHASAQASHCGYHKMVVELRNRYGDFEDFKKGRKENDLSKYDSVWGLACGKLERNLEDFLTKVKARESQ